MWKEGVIGVPTGNGNYDSVKYWIKYYDEPSKDYGLDGGRISKLSLKLNGEWICEYDRGWNIEPCCKEEEITLSILIREYN